MTEFDRLIQIIERLRAPGGCPWDAEQTHASIAPCAIEEAYELVDAIHADDAHHIREELGDLLLQVVFHAVMGQESGAFTMAEVINGLIDKLIHRHPHVFGDATVKDAAEVTRNWEQLKRKEKGKDQRQTIFDGIPKTLPALLSARKVQSAAARAGHDWGNTGQVLKQLHERMRALSESITTEKPEQIAYLFGEFLFAFITLARSTYIDPEAALRHATNRFKKNFIDHKNG